MVTTQPTVVQDEALMAQARLRRVSEGIDRLPPRTREVFLLQRIDNLKYREIAEYFAEVGVEGGSRRREARGEEKEEKQPKEVENGEEKATEGEQQRRTQTATWEGGSK